MKRNVYLVDLGTGSNLNLLPLGIGLIASYGRSIPELDSAYDFHLRFLRDSTDEFVASLDQPVVAGFACYVWNIKATLTHARATKEAYPDAQIVVGGSSVPKRADRIQEFLVAHPWVDVLVHGEGEFTFAELLRSLANGGELKQVESLTIRDPESDAGFLTTPRRARVHDLNEIPSPFLNGMFDDLMDKHGDRVTGVVLETNRGCPYACSFCDWGNADVSKIKRIGVDRTFAEFDWVAKNKIGYAYIADANFGIFYEHDLKLARHIAERSRSTGFPKFMGITWAKNSNERVVTIAKQLADAGIRVGVTLAAQSFNKDTLSAIRRRNIKQEYLPTLQNLFHERGIVTYTDLILGLPEETSESFTAGLEKVMTMSEEHHWIVHLCNILENTEMAEPEYLETYKIETRTCAVTMTMRTLDEETVPEEEDIVVGTSTMPLDEWRDIYVISYLCTGMHNLRMAFFIMNFLRHEFGCTHTEFIQFVINESRRAGEFPVIARCVGHLENQREMIIDGGERISPMAELGGYLASPQEAVLAVALDHCSELYEELAQIARNFCRHNGYDVAEEILDEVVAYQKARVSQWQEPQTIRYEFEHNIPQFFDALTNDLSVPSIHRQISEMDVIVPQSPAVDKCDFARLRTRGGRYTDLYDVELRPSSRQTSDGVEMRADMAG